MTEENDKKEQELEGMDMLLRRVAAFRGILIADRAEAVMLFATFILFIVNKYRNPVPLYICLFNLLVPIVLGEFLKRKFPASTSEDDLPLPLFRKKYRYSANSNKAHSINFILVTLLLFFWSQRVINTTPAYLPARSLPLLLLIMYVVIRLAFWAYYLVYFKFFTMKAIK